MSDDLLSSVLDRVFPMAGHVSPEELKKLVLKLHDGRTCCYDKSRHQFMSGIDVLPDVEPSMIVSVEWGNVEVQQGPPLEQGPPVDLNALSSEDATASSDDATASSDDATASLDNVMALAQDSNDVLTLDQLTALGIDDETSSVVLEHFNSFEALFDFIHSTFNSEGPLDEKQFNMVKLAME